MWAAEAHELAKHTRADDPGSWFYPLGLNLSPSLPNAVLTRIEYGIPSGVQLVRPTQLEARNNPHHLPSPPCHPRHGGGLAMRLDEDAGIRTSTNYGSMVPEYIHTEIDFGRGSIVDIALPAIGLVVSWDEFLQLRDHQFRRYYLTFQPALGGWTKIFPRRRALL